MVAPAFTAPSYGERPSGPLVGGDPTRRCFDGWLAKLIRLRDQPVGIRTVMHRSATLTTSPGTATTDSPL